MDPVANINEQRQLARRIQDATDRSDRPDPDDVDRLVELVLALDEWRRAGGFDPYGSA